mgnify:CR=1 FL=1
MNKRTKDKAKQQLKALARIRGEERKAHFANGGTLHEWRGGVHTITKNRKREENRRACRNYRGEQ